MRITPLLAVAALSLSGTLIARAPQTAGSWPLEIEPITNPSAPDSAQPQLHVSPKGVTLSWIERNGAEATLRYADRTPSGAWSAGRTVASGADWFVNWADVPSVIRLDNGTLVAHWLQKSGADTYAYDVKLSYSRDDGKTWSAPIKPHSDATKTEHGFVSMIQMPRAGLGLVWLDGRKMAGGHGAPGGDGHASGDMTLRFGIFAADWKQTAETELDARVCECCPTAIAMTAEGPVVAYRDRSPEEVRDIVITRLENGKWTAPKAVHDDGWRVPACPVNGPALSARGKTVVAAWFNAKNDQPKSFAAFSSDSGRTFSAPIRIDDAASLGRVDVELLPDGSAAAAYMEFAEQRAQFRVRRIRPDGSKSDPVTVSGMAGNRGSGYPRMVLSGDELVFAWTDRDTKAQVRTASARIPK